MKKICAISGFPLTISSHFSNYFTRSVHPLLEVRTEKLVELAGSKSWMDWQEEEAKLLFLAIANSLEMLEVTAPAIANPSPQVIASSIEMLVAIAGWHSLRQFPLPKLHITVGSEAAPSNERMTEFPALLTSIIATRDETREDDKRMLEASRLEETIRILYGKCSIGANKTKMLRSKAADWAIKITLPAARKERVTPDVTELWLKMLQTAPLDAHKFEDVDIQELDEFMTCNLPHGCTASYEVMKHLTAMKQATMGLASFLGVDNVIDVIEQPLKDAPVESAFSSKLDFLVAKAKFLQSAGSRKQELLPSAGIAAISYEELIPEELELAELEAGEFEAATNSDEGGNDDESI